MRSMIAIAEAKYSQCPCLRSNKKLARGSRGVTRESCNVYPNFVLRYDSIANALS